MHNPEQGLMQQVAKLIEREHAIRERLADPGDPDRINERMTLRGVEEELDQCWDLLRQRRALAAVRLDPDVAQVRPVSQVQNYLPRPGEPR